jgi:hypothetical protein
MDRPRNFHLGYPWAHFGFGEVPNVVAETVVILGREVTVYLGYEVQCVLPYVAAFAAYRVITTTNNPDTRAT